MGDVQKEDQKKKYNVKKLTKAAHGMNALYLEKDEKVKILDFPIISLASIEVSAFILAAQSHQHPLPKTYKEAKAKYWDDWKPAFEKQLQDLAEKGAWELVYPPKGAQVLPGKWVFDQKHNDLGNWLRNRARWVVCGNFQNDDDWAAQDIFAASANAVAVKIFFTLVVILGMESIQLDIVTAFLNAILADEDAAYVAQSTGFIDGTKKVCKLKKAFYDLRKSPHL
jgi:hypothetical protein